MSDNQYEDAHYDAEKDVMVVAGITTEQYSYYDRLQAERYGNILVERQCVGHDNFVLPEEKFSHWINTEAEKNLL